MQSTAMSARDFDGTLAAALAAPHPDEEKREMLLSLGLPGTVLGAIALGIGLKAAGGDVSAAKFIRDICREGQGGEEETDLTPFSEQELRALLRNFEEDTHDT